MRFCRKVKKMRHKSTIASAHKLMFWPNETIIVVLNLLTNMEKIHLKDKLNHHVVSIHEGKE